MMEDNVLLMETEKEKNTQKLIIKEFKYTTKDEWCEEDYIYFTYDAEGVRQAHETTSAESCIYLRFG